MPLPETEEFNRLFVKEIEKRPLLYKITMKEYSNSVEKKRAWRKIAQKFNNTEADCKLRWKNLRTCFVRYTKSSSAAKKPYYLYNIMQFILPYIKSVPQADPLSSTSQPPENSNSPLSNNIPEDEIKTESVTVSNEDASFMSDATPSESDVSDYNYCSSPIRKKQQRYHARSEFRSDYFENGYEVGKKEIKQEVNPDLDFFKSLLADIAQFNPAQKRKFKRQVLQLIDDISLL